ncbi:MAG TPA: DUF2141 domain-containing protein [Saprospiraceae bacterium]|nr:DUF2141 domain-containing protein [Saprospiraceae bacterium]HND88640.1 DUF2141 domain-containing protein [Saprospiraceae bacterium]HNG89643.1 DUF2141 domain-containing protein [Saprospiraceae bacterium]
MFFITPPVIASVLTLSFTGILQPQGNLYVAVYNRESAFLNTQEVCAQRIVPISATSLSVTLDGLSPGTYAISCFQDVNGNGKLDTNWAGIPQEPFGFSNNVRPQFGPPSWAEAKFEHPGAGSFLSIQLIRW